MSAEVEELASLLDEAAQLLRLYGHSYWADWLSLDARRIRNLDFYGIEHLLSAFGGMGSLNDLSLLQPDVEVPGGHDLEADDKTVCQLISRVYGLASKLYRDELEARQKN